MARPQSKRHINYHCYDKGHTSVIWKTGSDPLPWTRDGNKKLTIQDDVDDEKDFNYRIREENIKVEVISLPWCMGDKSLVSQALSNIVDNALKYLDSSRRGILTISGRLEDGQATVDLQTLLTTLSSTEPTLPDVNARQQSKIPFGHAGRNKG